MLTKSRININKSLIKVLRHASNVVNKAGPDYDANGVIELGGLASIAERTGGTGYPLLVPTHFNDYVSVALLASRVRADEVKFNDILLLDGQVSRVEYITPIESPRFGTILHIAGHVNITRFPHEYVSVLRAEKD